MPTARALLLAPSVAYAATEPPGDAPAREAPLTASGTLKADQMSFQAYKVSALNTKLRLYPAEIFLDELNMNLYGGTAKGDLEFNFAAPAPHYRIKARVNSVDMGKLLADIPGAAGWMTGKGQGEIDLNGEVVKSPDPLAGMRGTGQVSVKNGNMPKLQLNKNLLELAKLSKIGPTSGDPGAFSSIAADLNIADGRITSRKISVVGNGVNADGSGSMTLAGEGTLDYQGVASLAAGSNQLSTLLAGLAGGTVSNGRLNFPFGIGGTLSAPKYIQKGTGANRMSALGQLTGANKVAGEKQNAASAVQGIIGAFRKKKQQ